MHIEHLRVQNYRSIWDSGDLAFYPGFNIVVGPNNVGKTSLLHALTTRIQSEPHRSLVTLPTREDTLPPTSRIAIKLSSSIDEIKRLSISAGSGRRYLPWPAGVAASEANSGTAFNEIFNTPRLSFRATLEASRGSTGWSVPQYPSTQGYAEANVSGMQLMLAIDVDASALTISPRFPEGRQSHDDFGLTLTQLLAGRIFRFNAERLSLGSSQYGSSAELTHDARNLAEVLNVLQGNPQRFEEYNALVSEVFPMIKKVSVKPNAQNLSEILVWQIDPKTQRDDLATPLALCGTGVGQVLALLYVAKNLDQPRSIIIDEPGSFLHPGASRALIRILKKLSHHQYIIATHSPEVLSELSGAPITRVQWNDAKSRFIQAPATSGRVASETLSEIGARLSDVYGFDRIVWTEGQSDADGITAMLNAKGQLPVGLGVVPVRDTGAFRRRTIAEVLDIYHSLSLKNALLPPTLAFVFDRDGRSEKEMDDATRQSKGKVVFLPRRMLENYLLEAQAIALLFNKYEDVHGKRISAEQVTTWLTTKLQADRDGGGEELTLEGWKKVADGAGLLAELFLHFSDARYEYRKTTHTPELVAEVLRISPSAFDDVTALIPSDAS